MHGHFNFIVLYQYLFFLVDFVQHILGIFFKFIFRSYKVSESSLPRIKPLQFMNHWWYLIPCIVGNMAKWRMEYDKWQEFVKLASQDMANHPTRHFTETVAMYLGDPCHINFQVLLWNSTITYFLIDIYSYNFFVFYKK